MKQVFNNQSEVAHIWANRLQDNARYSGDNFFFDGPTIYSYGRHFPIATIRTNEKGDEAVLFTTRKYSNTTTKHIQIVRQACNHLYKIYCPHPTDSPESNFLAWTRQAENIAIKLAASKKPEKYLLQLDRILHEADDYCAFVGAIIPEPLVNLLSTRNKEDYIIYSQAKEDALKAELIAKAERENKAHKAALGKWLSGKSDRLYMHNARDYLRVSGAIIETSQAVKLPYDYAKKVWSKVKDGSLKAGDHVLDFEVKEVGKTIRIGCHTFPAKYLIDFGNKHFVNQ